MDLALTLVAMAATVILVARACEPIGIPPPLALLGVGVLASFLPFIPDVALSPDVVLFGLLPPLLYAAALNASLLDMRTYLVPIIGLSVGLVLFTALGVGLLVSWLLPVDFAIAFALGAIVAPPDAVATTAVARRIGLPRRTTTILEGESLLNDATALVALRTAIAAAGLVVGHGGGGGEHAEAVASVGLGVVAGDFAMAVVGGLGVGWIVYLLVGLVRRHLTEPAADTSLSFAVPFLAYVPAEHVGGSGVLAVVAAGLLLGHRAPVLQSAPSRLSERVNWASITFLLENSVFLLIGLQMAGIVDDVEASELTLGRGLAVGLAVLLLVLVLRPVWMIPFTWVTVRKAERTPERLKAVLVGSWAGMRGVVTLAAALTLPDDTPLRSVLVLIALVVTVGTLVLQGFTLPVLARALDVRGPDPRADALMEATVLQSMTAAGLRAIEADPLADPNTVEELRSQAAARVNRVWERLGSYGERDDETPSEANRRVRLEMIDAERVELLRIRDVGEVDHAVLDAMMRQLDAEESAVTWAVERHALVTSSPLRAPDQVSGECAHLDEEPVCAVPSDAEGCHDCLVDGTTWVHLRLCTHCGNVGCCDSSPGKHASAHFARSEHPVVRSLEPGELWRWCFVDEVLG